MAKGFASLARFVQPELVARTSVTPRSQVTPGVSGGWCVHAPGETLLALGPHFEEQARFPLPTRWFSTHAVSPDGTRAYLSLRTSVRCITPGGDTVWDVPHPAWGYQETSYGSCQVSPDGRQVWAAVPSPGGPDAWWVLDAGSGALLGQAALASHAAGSRHVLHPDGKRMVLAVRTAQDSPEAYWGTLGAEGVTVERQGLELLDIHPDGAQCLAMVSHPGGRALAVLPFPSGPAVAALTAPEVFPPSNDFPGGPESFTGFSRYVTEDLVLATSAREGVHALLSAKDLTRVALFPFGFASRGGAAATDGHGHFVTYDSVRELRLWKLGAEVRQ